MLLHNKWTHGRTKLHLPALPAEYVAMSGTMFKAFTFDSKVGEETCLLILDDPEFACELGCLNPFHLRATAGMARTSAGMIAYIIWGISSSEGDVGGYEQMLNPFNIETIQLISGVAQQTHLKVLMVNSLNGEVVGFYEIANTFDLDQLAAGIGQNIGNEPVADFAATQAALHREFSLEDLMSGG